jgi:hypothetical protein
MADLFKPGAYTKGTIVVDQYGVQWIADVDIKNALAWPRDGAYWTRVEAAPIPPSVVSGYGLNLRDAGLSVDKTPAENSLVIEKFTSGLKVGATDTVYLPSGHYNLLTGIVLDSKPIRFIGDNDSIFTQYGGTRLIFPEGVTGIMITRAQGSQGIILENLCLVAQNKTIEWCSGVAIRARATLRNITTKGFSHNGIDFWANMDEGNDASGSWVEHCHSLENGHDGFFAGRTDANAITFIGCDSRDNGRYGFNDDSFLGNYFFGAMAHNNAAGHWFVRDKGNARTTLVACYAESGSPASQLSPLTKVFGGFHASGYDLQDGKGVIYQ